jgi:SET domain-containing protein
MKDSTNIRINIIHSENKGRGVFAVNLIKPGDLIFDWEKNGIIYEVEKASDLPQEVKDYAIQIASNKWIDTAGFGRTLNHSCSPNAGIKGLFKLVAIRNIQPEEEIVWDYDITENSDWVMQECRCASDRCRKLIHGFRFLSDETKEEYKEITSDWLKKLD